jgi:hypothetical protein
MFQFDGLAVLLLLLLGHVIGDFFLQPNAWVKDKNTQQGHSRSLYYHGLVHGAIVLAIVGVATPTSLLGSLFIGLLFAVIHSLIDYVKVKVGQGFSWFIIDQLLHVLSILFLWFYLFDSAIEQLKTLINDIDYNAALLIALAYLMMLKPASIVIGEILSKWSADLDVNSGDSHNTKAQSLPDAGKYLGYLERILVLTFILNGQYTAVGFVLAAKSIFRMGDLREAHDRKFTEYVMLGSLFSVSIALFTGFIVLKLLP